LIVATDGTEKKKESTDYFSCIRILYIYENVCVSNYIIRHNIKGEIDFLNIFIRNIYWSMTSKQDIICTCKRGCRYRKEIHIYERYKRRRISFITDSVVIYTYNQEMRDRSVCLFLIIFSFFTKLRYILFYLNIFTLRYTWRSSQWRYNNLRFKLDYHSNVFVKVGARERAISEDKLSLLKFQSCSS